MNHERPDTRQPRPDQGQGMVEFALLLPVLFLMMWGLINFAYIFQAYIQVVNAAGVGAAWGASSPIAAADSDGIAIVALAESSHWHCLDTAVTSFVTGDPQGFGRVSVSVSCDVRDLIAIPASFGQVVVHSTATRRVRP